MSCSLSLSVHEPLALFRISFDHNSTMNIPQFSSALLVYEYVMYCVLVAEQVNIWAWTFPLLLNIHLALR